jgi:hypothetical protein
METLIDALGKTPLPTILVVAGIIFLFLAVGGQLGARFSSARLKPLYALVIGLILLGAGVWMQVIQGRATSAEGAKDKPVNAQASPAATAVTAEKYALRAPAMKGKLKRVAMKMEMPEASLTVEAGGKYVTGTGSTSVEGTQTIEIVAVEDGRPSVLRQKILGDNRNVAITLDGKVSNKSEKGPLEGATVLVELKNGRWVRSLMGNTPNPEQKVELQQPFVNSDDIYPTDRVSPGFVWQLKDYQLAHFFPGALSATGDAWCTFTGVETHQDRKCAVISTWLQISYKALVNNNPAEFSVGASCIIYRALDKLVDIESNMDGQMTMKLLSVMNGAKTTIEMNGPLHAVSYVTDISDQPQLSTTAPWNLRLATLVSPGDEMFWSNSHGASAQSSKYRRRFSLP